MSQCPINAANAPVVISSPNVFSMRSLLCDEFDTARPVTFQQQYLCPVMGEFLWQAERPVLIRTRVSVKLKRGDRETDTSAYPYRYAAENSPE
jgi:hypothetical protein